MKRGIRSLETVSDEVLARAVRRGINGAFDMLVVRHSPQLKIRLHKWVHDNEAVKDVLQDLWLLVLQALRTGRYREAGKFESWINKLAFVKGKKAWCKELRHIHGTYEDYPAEEEEQDDGHAAEVAGILKPFLEKLKPKMQRIVRLRAVEGLPFKTISDMTNIPENEVRVYYGRAIERMKKYFSKSVAK